MPPASLWFQFSRTDRPRQPVQRERAGGGVTPPPFGPVVPCASPRKRRPSGCRCTSIQRDAEIRHDADARAEPEAARVAEGGLRAGQCLLESLHKPPSLFHGRLLPLLLCSSIHRFSIPNSDVGHDGAVIRKGPDLILAARALLDDQLGIRHGPP